MQRFRFINFILISFLTFVAVFLLVSVPSFAMSSISDYPCYVNQNGNIPFEVIMFADQNYGQSYFIYLGSAVGSDSYGSYYPFYAFPKNSSGSLFANINSDNTFSLIGYNIGYYDAKVGTIKKNYQGSWVFSGIQGNYSYWWYQNRPSSMVDSSVDYYTNFDLRSNSDHTQKVISTGTPPLVLPDGDDPTVFDDTGLNLDSSLNANTVPSAPSGFSYTAPTAPTWDSSQPVQSVWDYIVYGFSCLIALLQGVINTISNWISYLGNLLTYVIQKILNFLKAIVEWLYQQFLAWLTPYLKLLIFISKILFDEETQKNLFQLITDFHDDVLSWFGDFWDNSFISDFWDNMVSYFSNVFTFFRVIVSLGTENGEFSIITLFSNVFRILFIPDSDDLSSLLVRHDIYGVLDFAELIQTNINYIKSLLTVNTRSVNYKFTLPDITIMGVQCGSYDIDFSWYLNYKNVGDPIISAFLIFGWFLWIHGRLPYWLRGQQGDVSGLAREVQK